MGFFFFSSRRRHTRYWRDWSSDVCSSDLDLEGPRYRPRGIRDGDAGAYLSEVEGSDTPTGVCGRRQGLLLRTGEPMVQDLARPLQGFRDGLEVVASGLGHRRPPATAAAEHA